MASVSVSSPRISATSSFTPSSPTSALSITSEDADWTEVNDEAVHSHAVDINEHMFGDEGEHGETSATEFTRKLLFWRRQAQAKSNHLQQQPNSGANSLTNTPKPYLYRSASSDRKKENEKAPAANLAAPPGRPAAPSVTSATQSAPSTRPAAASTSSKPPAAQTLSRPTTFTASSTSSSSSAASSSTQSSHVTSAASSVLYSADDSEPRGPSDRKRRYSAPGKQIQSLLSFWKQMEKRTESKPTVQPTPVILVAKKPTSKSNSRPGSKPGSKAPSRAGSRQSSRAGSPVPASFAAAAATSLLSVGSSPASAATSPTLAPMSAPTFHGDDMNDFERGPTIQLTANVATKWRILAQRQQEESRRAGEKERQQILQGGLSVKGFVQTVQTKFPTPTPVPVAAPPLTVVAAVSKFPKPAIGNLSAPANVPVPIHHAALQTGQPPLHPGSKAKKEDEKDFFSATRSASNSIDLKGRSSRAASATQRDDKVKEEKEKEKSPPLQLAWAVEPTTRSQSNSIGGQNHMQATQPPQPQPTQQHTPPLPQPIPVQVTPAGKFAENFHAKIAEKPPVERVPTPVSERPPLPLTRPPSISAAAEPKKKEESRPRAATTASTSTTTTTTTAPGSTAGGSGAYPLPATRPSASSVGSRSEAANNRNSEMSSAAFTAASNAPPAHLLQIRTASPPPPPPSESPPPEAPALPVADVLSFAAPPPPPPVAAAPVTLTRASSNSVSRTPRRLSLTEDDGGPIIAPTFRFPTPSATPLSGTPKAGTPKTGTPKTGPAAAPAAPIALRISSPALSPVASPKTTPKGGTPLIAPVPQSQTQSMPPLITSPALNASNSSPSLQALPSPVSLSSPTGEQLPEHWQEHRERVLAEIVSSEEKYVVSLQALLSDYVHPLKSAHSSVDISLNQASLIFSNVELIANFHHVFFKELSSAVSKCTNVAECFLRYSDFMKMYSVYVNSYPSILSTIDVCSRGNGKFQQFLAEKKQKNGLDLLSYLIMPIQRIPRYELLLRELIKNTPSIHPEYSRLKDAFDKVQSIASFVNEEKRHVENMNKLLQIQSSISGDFGTLVMPHRRLVREGLLQKVSPGLLGSTLHMRKVYLFSDILLWTTNSNKFRGHISLEAASVASVEASESKEGKDGKRFPFKILMNADKSHLEFICSTSDDRDEWIRDIDAAARVLAEATEQARKRKVEIRIKAQRTHRRKDKKTKGSGDLAQLYNDPAMHNATMPSSVTAIGFTAMMSPTSTNGSSSMSSGSNGSGQFSGSLPRSETTVARPSSPSPSVHQRIEAAFQDLKRKATLTSPFHHGHRPSTSSIDADIQSTPGPLLSPTSPTASAFDGSASVGDGSSGGLQSPTFQNKH